DERPLNLGYLGKRHGEGELAGCAHAGRIGEEDVVLFLHRDVEAGQRPGLAVRRHEPRLVFRGIVELDGRMDMETHDRHAPLYRHAWMARLEEALTPADLVAGGGDEDVALVEKAEALEIAVMARRD